MPDKSIWNFTRVTYAKELEYRDFVTDPKDATIIKFDKPINEGERPGWSFKNLVTKDMGSDKVYMAWIHFDAGGGHDYHAHSSDEIIHVLKGTAQFTFSSKSREDIQSKLEAGGQYLRPRGDAAFYLEREYWAMRIYCDQKSTFFPGRDSAS